LFVLDSTFSAGTAVALGERIVKNMIVAATAVAAETAIPREVKMNIRRLLPGGNLFAVPHLRFGLV
jgi:hypothetical protein